MIKRMDEEARLKELDYTALKTLQFVAGLQDPSLCEVRLRMLRRLDTHTEESPLTIEHLVAECENFTALKMDNTDMEGSHDIHVVQKKNVKCFNCGRPHYRSTCPLLSSSTGQKMGQKPRRRSNRRRKGQCKNVVTFAAENARTYLDVNIRGRSLRFQLDTGADITDNAVPVFKEKRPVPYASMPDLDAEIDRLVAEQVISPVEHSEWATPMVVVKKKSGQIRLCGDFSTGLNDALQLHQHPLPTAKDVFTKLNGGRLVTQIDFAEAYLQVEVEEESKEMLTINTQRGLYRYNRLPFGVKSAPGIFQQIMDSMICGLEGVAAYLDDVIVTGRTQQEHRHNLEALFGRIQEYGLRVRLEKCNFLMPQIRYLGCIIDKDGRHPDLEKIEVIRQMPVPQNVAELRAPLDALLKKNVPFKWNEECEAAFNRAKEVLASDLLLTHFDSSLDIIVAADASDHGIGAVILHRMPDGTEKAIWHASRSLTAAERNYGQIEKEGLALIFAVRKFHRYIYGRRFKLITDHKPLLHIFGPKKMVPVYTANRLQRWKLILLGHEFDIEYQKTTEFGQADVLSRLIPPRPAQTEDVVIDRIEQDILAVQSTHLKALPVTRKTIEEESRKDERVSQVIWMLQTGTWPRKPKEQINSLKALSHELSVQNGCLYFGHRIVVPASLQEAVLKQLQEGHQGMTRMKMLARGYLYWTNINRDIEEAVRHFRNCQEAAKMPKKTVLNSWTYTGPLNGRMYLVVVDAYSKWPEVFEMSSSSTTAMLRELRMLFARFGNPRMIVSDNGTQFTAKEFQEFCDMQGIEHVCSPPFHQQSNGQVELFVDTLKRTLQKIKERGTSEKLAEFLQRCRRTPCASTPGHVSPAEPHNGREHLLSATKEERVVYDDCVLEDFLSQGDCYIEEYPNVDYEMLLRALRTCAERASKQRTTNLDRISKTTKELLERRRTLRLHPNASHIEWLVANTSCRKALQEDLLKYRQKKILEAAQRRTSLKKCRRDLREYNIPLAALLSEDGTRTSSRREMEIITEWFYSNLFRSSTPVSSPIIPIGEAPPRILPSEVRVGTKSMKPGTASGPNFISADSLRAGGHPLHVILAAHMTSYIVHGKKRLQTSGRPREPFLSFLSIRKVTERTFGTTVRYAC
ncbi:hypothetical protein RB195_022856 [Necator americanus]|uniref:RNA-directed DNA polymerase n=1 Tax=Necator americanus TaxID=51031 RepID=A0ABR1EGX1_NECAM